jgi:hypothetical protein
VDVLEVNHQHVKRFRRSLRYFGERYLKHRYQAGVEALLHGVLGSEAHLPLIW